MEQKKEIKISLNTAIVLILIIVIIALFLILFFKMKGNGDFEKIKNTNTNSKSNYYIDTYQEQDYYIINKDYSGEYEIQYKNLYQVSSAEDFNINRCVSYNEYVDFCKRWNLNQKYKNKEMKYIMFSYIDRGSPNLEARLSDVEFNGKSVKLYIWDDSSGVTADVMAYIIIIPTHESVEKVETQVLYTKAEFNSMSNKYKVTGYTYTPEDNKKIAEKSHISSNNSKLNNIINNMFDSIVKEHTIKLEQVYNDDYGIEYIDLYNSALKCVDKDNYVWFYMTFTDMETIKYMDINKSNSYEKTTANNSREDMLTEISELEPLFNTNSFSYKIDEDSNNYIIAAEKEEEKVTYYINKANYLLNKIRLINNYSFGISEENVTVSYTQDEVIIPKKIVNSSKEFVSIDKPIIYLYPEQETKVTIKLGNPEKITTSYPKYSNGGWRVIARPNGELTDLNTGRNLYSLYWEGIESSKTNMKEGFVIRGENSASFLEEKLKILGLTEREAEEFIIYWLPKLEKNKYNYIRFAKIEEINEYMPLEFSIKPDTLIRVLMQFKGLENPIEVQEQELETPERTGFVAVEWGGTEIK